MAAPSKSPGLGGAARLVVAHDEAAVRPPIDAVDLPGDGQRATIPQIDTERLREVGLPGRRLAGEAEAHLEVDGHGCGVTCLAIQPQDERVLEALALALPQHAEAREGPRPRTPPSCARRSRLDAPSPPGWRVRGAVPCRVARARIAPPPRGRASRAPADRAASAPPAREQAPAARRTGGSIGNRSGRR